MTYPPFSDDADVTALVVEDHNRTNGKIHIHFLGWYEDSELIQLSQLLMSGSATVLTALSHDYRDPELVVSGLIVVSGFLLGSIP